MNTSRAIHVIGPNPEDIKQLDKLSNIAQAGEWMYRVDLADSVNPCLNSMYQPPLCDRPIPKSTTQASATVSSNRPGSDLQSSTPYSHPLINFEDNGETVTFPSFITLLPQLVTAKKDRNLQIVTANVPTTNQENTTRSAPITFNLPAVRGEWITSTMEHVTPSSAYSSEPANTTNSKVHFTLQPDFPSGDSQSTIDLPDLKLFTQASTTKRSTRLPVPIKLPTVKPSLKEKPVKTGGATKKTTAQESYDQRKSGVLTDDDDLNSTGSMGHLLCDHFRLPGWNDKF